MAQMFTKLSALDCLIQSNVKEPSKAHSVNVLFLPHFSLHSYHFSRHLYGTNVHKIVCIRSYITILNDTIYMTQSDDLALHVAAQIGADGHEIPQNHHLTMMQNIFNKSKGE